MEHYCKECEFYKAPDWGDEDRWNYHGECNHPRNLKEKWNWREKWFVNKRSPHKLNKDRQCEWHEYKKSIYKEGSHDYYAHQLELCKSVLKDLCDEETDCQEMALKVLTKEEVYGDSYCAHGMRQIVEQLVARIKQIEKGCVHEWILNSPWPCDAYCSKCGVRK